jgi:hypothetical protein
MSKKIDLVLTETPVSSKQLLRLLQKTPDNHKYTRPAKGGGSWDYVTGVYVKKTLNYVFGWLWSFDIISIEEKHNQVVCRGKLTINKPDGTALMWKTDIGRADIKYKTEYKDGQKIQSSNPLDYGNDEKASATDCLKRCAFQLGIASDIYGKNEFNEIREDVVKQILSDVPDVVVGDTQTLPVEVIKQIRATKDVDKLIEVSNELTKKLGKEYEKLLLKEFMVQKDIILGGLNDNS